MDANKINNQAYDDVLDHSEPTQPDNPEYMRAYRTFRSIANWPEDQISPGDH